MKKQAVILGGIVIVALSSSMSEAALSFLKDDQWSNYTQSWKTPLVVRSKRATIAQEKELESNKNDSIDKGIKRR